MGRGVEIQGIVNGGDSNWMNEGGVGTHQTNIESGNVILAISKYLSIMSLRMIANTY